MSISSDNIRPCEICERTYNHDRLTTCPRCKGDVNYLEKLKKAREDYVEPVVERIESSTKTAKPAREPSKDELIIGLLQELVAQNKQNRKATDRTTFAVRAMVSYTVISMMTAVLAGLLLWAGFKVKDETGFWLVLAIIVLIVGNLIATYTLYKEWTLSKVQNS